ncbi:uncharacterized protein [Panulirus ornatus]|uniref:uncharacterized protein isoform X2 n=1 Tax=Panulirus ornatus TaxID=150431 RepID=UPI003A8646BF
MMLWEAKEQGFSLVWRPLLARFSRDPEMIYWVPPLYSSHSFSSIQSFAQEPQISQSALDRTRSSCAGQNSSSGPSRLEYVGASCVTDTSMSDLEHSHPYETVLTSQDTPVSFDDANDSRDKPDYFFYEQEKTPLEGLSHGGLSGPCANMRDNQGSVNPRNMHWAHAGSFTNGFTYKSVGDDYVEQSIRQRPSSSSSTPKNRDIMPKELKVAASGTQSGRCIFNDDPEAVHRLAACKLLSQASLRSKRSERVDASWDNLSYLERDSCRHFRHEQLTQDDNAYQLNKSLYIFSVVMLLLLGVVVIVVVVLSTRFKT